MNNKEMALMKIVDAVVSCCATRVSDDGKMSITKDDVLGKTRCTNAVMTRCILVGQIIAAGYSVTTAAQLLKRTEHAVRHLLELGYSYMMSSRAYRIADAQATLLCKDIGGEGL